MNNDFFTMGSDPIVLTPLYFQTWYNMRINMSREKPMGIAAKGPQVRYSAAYPTGRERIVKGLLSHGGCPHSIPKGTSLPRGLIP